MDPLAFGSPEVGDGLFTLRSYYVVTLNSWTDVLPESGGYGSDNFLQSSYGVAAHRTLTLLLINANLALQYHQKARAVCSRQRSLKADYTVFSIRSNRLLT